MKKYFRVIWTIALNTFRETIRDRILYSLIGFAALVIAAGLLAGSVSLGQDLRVIESFGLTTMLIFLLIITLFVGTQIVWREVERKTIYLTLTKPVSRDQFYLGKYLGICLTTATSALIMGAIFLLEIYFKAHLFSLPALWSILWMILEVWLLTALGLMLSTFTAPLSSAIYTFCLALIGHAATSIWQIAQKSPAVLKYTLEFIYYLFPNLEKFNLRNEVIYAINPPFTQIWTTVLYFAGYTALLLILGLMAFRQDEF